MTRSPRSPRPGRRRGSRRFRADQEPRAEAGHTRAAPLPWLQFWLHSPAYSSVQEPHPPQPHRRSERSRTPLYPQTNIWKACWGQPLTSSNLVSSAIALTGQYDEGPDRPRSGSSSRCVSVSVSGRPSADSQVARSRVDSRPRRGAEPSPQPMPSSGPRSSRPRTSSALITPRSASPGTVRATRGSPGLRLSPPRPNGANLALGHPRPAGRARSRRERCNCAGSALSRL